MYIAQDLAKGNFGYKYIMYKHGPYSFDLKNELSGMKASNMIEYTFPREEYGPGIEVTKFGDRVFKTHQEDIEKYHRINEFVSSWLAASDVTQLEKLATAYFVTQRNPREPLMERAKRISGLKPHVDLVAAEEALKTIDEKRQEAKRQSFLAA